MRRHTFLASLAAAALSPRLLAQSRRLRVLHVMSYHSPWRWTDGQLEGFKETLAGLPVDYTVYQMDTKRHSTEAAKQRRGQEARALVARLKPDLLYTSDDDAQAYVARHFVGSTLPVVFSGVNAEPSAYGFAGAPNVTGVLEHEHFIESVKLLQSISPNVRRLAVVLDDAPMWQPVVARMRAAAAGRRDFEITTWDTPRTLDGYKASVRAYQGAVDGIVLVGIFNFKDAAGRNVPYEEVLRWTAENSRLPDASFWGDRVRHGTLASMTVSEREQGRAAGRLARQILEDGVQPGTLPMRPTAKGAPVVSLARARKLGLKVPSSVLLSAEVVQNFDWDAEGR